jgi:hypothetical protein
MIHCTQVFKRTVMTTLAEGLVHGFHPTRLDPLLTSALGNYTLFRIGQIKVDQHKDYRIRGGQLLHVPGLNERFKYDVPYAWPKCLPHQYNGSSFKWMASFDLETGDWYDFPTNKCRYANMYIYNTDAQDFAVLPVDKVSSGDYMLLPVGLSGPVSPRARS